MLMPRDEIIADSEVQIRKAEAGLKAGAGCLGLGARDRVVWVVIH